MFGIGFGELVIILIVLLIAVGPDKMPTFMKAVGKGLREFRRTTRELRNTVGIDELLRDDDLRRPLANKPRPIYVLTDEDKKKELPPEGADISHAVLHDKSARAFREPPPLVATPGPVAEPKPGPEPPPGEQEEPS
jgi:sec-independent protein translocase protein TatB